eukprot:TRINITY_DN2556_c0_g1_i6.p1 TRINITY_DN2556_c0_g1~~TRINITY_DN2556_c0_g1_i6.p1  ORF type:complete len:1708 (-),score=315.98 TRINITY_DN2556_c0_g1_i6:29-4411(-)
MCLLPILNRGKWGLVHGVGKQECPSIYRENDKEWRELPTSYRAKNKEQATLRFTKTLIAFWQPAFCQEVVIMARASSVMYDTIRCKNLEPSLPPAICLLDVVEKEQFPTAAARTVTDMAVLFHAPQTMYCYRVICMGGEFECKRLAKIGITAEGTLCGLAMTAEHIVVTYSSCILVYDTETYTCSRIDTTNTHYTYVDRSKVISVSEKGPVQVHSLLSTRSSPVSSCYELTDLGTWWSRAYVDSTCLVLGDQRSGMIYSEFGADTSEQRQRFRLNESDIKTADWQPQLDAVVHISHIILQLHHQAVRFYKGSAVDGHSLCLSKMKAELKKIHTIAQSLNKKGCKMYPATVLTNLDGTIVYEQQMEALTEQCNQFVCHVSFTGQVAKLFAQICQNLVAIATSSKSKKLYAPPDYIARKVAEVLVHTYKHFDDIIFNLHERKRALIQAILSCAARIGRQLAMIQASEAGVEQQDRTTLSADVNTTHEANELWAEITRTLKALQTIPTGELARAFLCTTNVSSALSRQQRQVEQLLQLDSSMRDAFAFLELCQVQLLLLQHGITETTSVDDVDIGLRALCDYADTTTDCYTRLDPGMRIEVQSRVSNYHHFIERAADTLVTETLPHDEQTARLDSIESLERINASLNQLCELRRVFPGLVASEGERKLQKLSPLIEVLLKVTDQQTPMNLYKMADARRTLKSLCQDSSIVSFHQLLANAAEAIDDVTKLIVARLQQSTADTLNLMQKITEWIESKLRSSYPPHIIGELIQTSEKYLTQLHERQSKLTGTEEDVYLGQRLQSGIDDLHQALNDMVMNSAGMLLSASDTTLETLLEAMDIFVALRDKPWLVATSRARLKQQMSRMKNLKVELLIDDIQQLLEYAVRDIRVGCIQGDTMCSVLEMELAARERLGADEKSRIEVVLNEAKDKLNMIGASGYRQHPQAHVLYDRISALINAEQQLAFVLRFHKPMFTLPTSPTTLTPTMTDISENLEMKPSAQIPQLTSDIEQAIRLRAGIYKVAQMVSPIDVEYMCLLNQAIDALDRKHSHCSVQLWRWIEAVLDYIDVSLQTPASGFENEKWQIYLQFVERLTSTIPGMNVRLHQVEKHIKLVQGTCKAEFLVRQLSALLQTASSMSLFELEQQKEWFAQEVLPNKANLDGWAQCMEEVRQSCKDRAHQSLLADLNSIRNLDLQGIPLNVVSANCLFVLCSHRLDSIAGYVDFKVYMSCLRQGESALEPPNAELFYDYYFARNSVEDYLNTQGRVQQVSNKELQAQARDQVDSVVKRVLSKPLHLTTSAASSNRPLLSRWTIREHLDMLTGLSDGVKAAAAHSIELEEYIVSVQQQLLALLPEATDDAAEEHGSLDKAHRYQLHAVTASTSGEGSCLSSTTPTSTTTASSAEPHQLSTCQLEQYLYDADDNLASSGDEYADDYNNNDNDYDYDDDNDNDDDDDDDDGSNAEDSDVD